MNQTYTREIEREIKRNEANFTDRFNNVRQDTLKQVQEELSQKSLWLELATLDNEEEVARRIRPLTQKIVNSVFDYMEGFFLDTKIQSKIDQKQPITAQDLDNEFNQSVLLSHWSQKKLKRFYQLKKLYLLQKAQKY
jgi:hypothetical protein